MRVSAQFLLLERSWHRSQGKGGPNERPRTPAPGPITFRLRLGWIYPVLADSDGVGFETMCYYLIINTINDLYCAVLREIAMTCNLAVTNCHGIYFPHSQSKILPKMPSPFEIKIISIRPPGFQFLCEAQNQSIVERVARLRGCASTQALQP